MSDTIIIAKAVIPPVPTPAIPLKTYNSGPFFANPHSRSPNARSTTAVKNTTFLPTISLTLPYRTWKTVFAINEEVPAHEMVFTELREAPIVGRAIPIAF